MLIGRRSMVGTGLALAAAPGLAAGGLKPTIKRLYGRAIVINGNLGGPFFEERRLTFAEVAEIRSSGLTAAKVTLGGDGMDRATTLAQLRRLERTIDVNRDVFMRIGKTADLISAKRSGLVGLIPSFEGGSMLEGRVDAIDAFRSLGVLVMGLSYNRRTPFGSGVLDPWSIGLTSLGREAVARMNALGVTVDVSHSDESTGLQAIEASRQPVLVTHAGSSAVHAHPRNKSDRLIRALSERGGVFGLYELTFIAGNDHQQSLSDYMAHLDHLLNVAGEDHVGVGSDAAIGRFDTSAASMSAWDADIARRRAAGVGAPGEGRPPFVTELNRADRMELIAAALASRGYRARVIEKVLGGNFERVFSETWLQG
ncbi:dipeptidase [Sphingomonas sp. BK580]|uniref:dipeptidase n=1 Tax=Sphingomonas sp. BK580 TaxID=2586972 RepID=UPI00160D0D31|nr:membrane dipeptidase [Sphingomonas sp. BK580]MBB3695157.1 membrane dipeptidase [Sphingomonas sp. BK580]